MRIGLLGKWLGTGLVLSVLAACGGGGSSSGTPFSPPQSGPTINALGVDGPILDAIVEVYALADYLTNGAGGATSLLAAPRRSDAVTGLIDDLELTSSAGPGPFVLVVTADGSTTDLSTGAAPVLGSVITVITAAQYALTPQPRFYATPLTTLAVRQAIQNAGGAGSATANDVLAGLAAAQTTIKTMFGFGITPSIDIFTTPPIIDSSTTDIAQQQSTAEYRTAIETLVKVIAAAGVTAGVDANAVVDALMADIADGVLDDLANPALFDAVNNTPNYADPATVLTLLQSEITTLGFGVNLVAGVTLPPGFPSVPDSDQDGLTNDNDDEPQISDVDGDQVLDGADNCPAAANPGQEDLDGDGAGNACDADADNDGVNGDGAGNPGDDVNDLDNAIATDADADGVDDVGGGTFNPTFSGAADNCPVANPNQLDLDGDGAGNACDADADNDGVNGDGAGNPGDDVNDLDNSIATDADADGVDDVGGGTFNPTFAGAADNCPQTPNSDQLNTATPNFALGDACDPDDDGVGSAPEVPADNCPDVANAAGQSDDLDADGEGDACDADIDGDTIPNALDPDPLSSAANYHSDTLFSALFAAGDQSAFGLFSGSANTVRFEDSAPLGTFNNTLDLGSNHFGVGTFALNHSVQEVITDLTLGGSCTPGGDCTTASTPTVTTEIPTLFQDGGSDAAFYTPPAGGSNGSLTVDYAEVSLGADIDTGSDAILDIEIDLDYASGGTAYAAFGQSFIGTQRLSIDLFAVTSEDVCATELGLNAFTDEPSLNSAVNAFVAANTDQAGAAIAVFSATNCAQSGGFVLHTLDVFSPEPTGLATSDFDGLTFGLVEFSSAYTTATTTDLMVLNSRVSNLIVTDPTTGAITASNTAAVSSSIGTTDAQLAYDTTDADITFITADAAGEGGIELTRDGGDIVTGFAANDLELLTFAGYTPPTATNTAVIDRSYAVQLGSGVVATDLDGALYDLQGIVVETANTGIAMRTFKGAAITFSAAGADITATLSGDVDGLGGEFDDANSFLPPLLGSTTSLTGLVSNTFSIAADGRFAPITFPGSGLELEGFYSANGGLVLRLVDTLSTTGGGGGGSVEFYCGSPAGQNFIDPNTSISIDPQPTGSFVCGFVLAGGGGISTPFTSDARGGTDQVFGPIAAGDEVLVVQGVLFGTINEPAL